MFHRRAGTKAQKQPSLSQELDGVGLQGHGEREGTGRLCRGGTEGDFSGGLARYERPSPEPHDASSCTHPDASDAWGP